MKKLSHKSSFWIISIISVMVIALVVRTILQGWNTEAYCTEQTNKSFGKNWNKMIPATEEEKKYLDKSLIKNGEISLGLHELFKCEHEKDKEFKYFILF